MAATAGLLISGPEWQAARSDLRELERQAIGSSVPEPVLYHLAQKLREAGRAGEGHAALIQAERLYPDSDRVRIARVRALAELGRWEEVDQALAYWRSELQSTVEAAILRARVDAEGRGRPREALERLKPLAEKHPRHAELQYLVGRAHAALYQPNESLTAFRQAAQADPGEFRYQRELAQTHLYFGQMQDAVRALRQARKLSPEDATTLYLLGACLVLVAQSPADEAEAREALEAAVAHNPGDAEIHCQLGQLSQSGRQFREAAAHFEQSLQLDPSHTDALYYLAQCRFRLGEDARGEVLMRAYSRLRGLMKSNERSLAFSVGSTDLSPRGWKQAARIYRETGFPEVARQAERAAATAVQKSPGAVTADPVSRG